MGDWAKKQAGKENPQNRDFESEASGKPTSSFDSDFIHEKRVVKKYITITDEAVWELIDEIMKVKEYEKSFNKVINHALKYGIVTLYEKLFVDEKKESIEDIKNSNVKQIVKTPEDKLLEKYMTELIMLSKENTVYVSIIKSIVSALYNVKIKELNDDAIPVDKVIDGSYRQTPKYLENYESRAFSNIRERD